MCLYLCEYVAVRSNLLVIFAKLRHLFQSLQVRSIAFRVVLAIAPPKSASPGIPVAPMTTADGTASAKQRFKQQKTPRWNFVRRTGQIEDYLLELEVTRMQEVAELRKEAVRMESKMDLMFAGSITFNVITNFLTAYYLRYNEVLKRDV